MNTSDKTGQAEVFISYSQDSVEHMEHVLKLSNRWMEKSIRDSKYVLLVCTARYLDRVMGQEKEGTGLGVRWEGNLVYQHVYNAGTLNTKFIPVVFKDEDKQFIPTPLQGSSYYCLANESGYEHLYGRLTGQSKTEKPKLGKRRSLARKSINPAMYLSSPIDVDLWNAAKWKATVFAFEHGKPPILGIAFLNEEPARKIFAQWRKRYGQNDLLEELRIAIVEGPIEGENPGYTVHIGPNPEAVIKRLKNSGYDVKDEDIHMFISRVNRMNPLPDSKNLELFKGQVEQHKAFFLAPTVISQDIKSVRPLLDLGIYKGKIYFRNVTDIGSNDIDSVALHLPKD